LGEEFKFYLVSWPKVCSPISEGGSGVRNLLMFNHALLKKWLWRYAYERERLYGEWWWILNMIVNGASGVLMKLMGHMGLVFGNSLGGVGRNFRGFIDLKWVMVQMLKFDMMCGVESNPLWSFSELFSIASTKEAFEADHLQLSNGYPQTSLEC